MKTEKLSNYFRTLANPNRLKIYHMILKEACECNLEKENHIWGNCVTIIAKKLRLGQPTVSNHVKELVNAGLIYSEKKGKNIYLFGDEKFLFELKDFTTFVEREIYGHD